MRLRLPVTLSCMGGWIIIFIIYGDDYAHLNKYKLHTAGLVDYHHVYVNKYKLHTAGLVDYHYVPVNKYKLHTGGLSSSSSMVMATVVVSVCATSPPSVAVIVKE